MRGPSRNLEEEGLDLVVEYEYESASGTSEHVGEGSLEEGVGALCLGDVAPTVHGAGVRPLGHWATGLHHHTPPHCVEGVGDNTGDSGYNLYWKTNMLRTLSINKKSINRVYEIIVSITHIHR